ncbi:S8 family serine peptidase [Ruegeria sp. HKCCD8929]|uniref:S8 family serine peptidase n=1 Tax=Ruegeria sp. HKCCD8929 TaxID=2683006 RepID=UPI001487E38A|nr:S8 family serine peptidase [Ruegeria sp. HKCCD8929]
MTKYSLTIGGTKIEFRQSNQQVAVRSRMGVEREFENEVAAFANSHDAQRLGPLGEFEIIELGSQQERISNVRDQLRRLGSIGYEVAVYHSSDDGVPFVPEGTIYVEFDEIASEEQRQLVIDKFRLQLVEAEPDGSLTVRVTGADDAVRVSADMQKEDVVQLAEPDLVTPAALKGFELPQDSLLNRQWHLKNTGMHGGQSIGYVAGADARVVEAWTELSSLGSQNVVIGVIDDGFDLSHPDFATKIIHPWDFTRQSNDVSPVPNLFDQRLGGWHGTACAGVATAKAGHGDVIGAAPAAQLIPVRWGPNLNPNGPRGVAKWFDHMTEKGAWVLSCSWGAAAAYYPLPTRTSKAIARCAKNGRAGKGTIILFAAGNSNRDINNPPISLDGFATHPDVIAVAASTSRDEKSHYSNFGDEISICAPSSGSGGWGIVTSDVTGTYIDANGVSRPMGYAAGDYTFEFGGTSSACPLAAGVAALVVGSNPDLTASEVREILESSARKIGDPSDYDANGHSRLFGFGCIDAAGAVKLAKQARIPGSAEIKEEFGQIG